MFQTQPARSFFSTRVAFGIEFELRNDGVSTKKKKTKKKKKKSRLRNGRGERK